MRKLEKSGRGSDRLERCVRVAEVGGSNPLAPTGLIKTGWHLILDAIWFLFSPRIRNFLINFSPLLL